MGVRDVSQSAGVRQAGRTGPVGSRVRTRVPLTIVVRCGAWQGQEEDVDLYLPAWCGGWFEHGRAVRREGVLGEPQHDRDPGAAARRDRGAGPGWLLRLPPCAPAAL